MATEDTDIIKRSLEILVVLNTAVKNVRLYPPASATVVNTLDKLHQFFLNVLDQTDQIIFGESEKKLLVDGEPLNQKDQEKPNVASLAGLLTAFNVKSITFSRGLEKEELAHFVNLISRKPETVASEGGLGKLLNDRNASHIILDQKVYVALDKNRQILSSLDITDDQFTKFLAMSRPDLDPDSPQLKELVRDPKALARAFEVGLSQMMAQKGKLSTFQISENINRMLWLVDNLSSNLDSTNRGILSQNVGQALITADQTMAEHLTTQNVEHLLGGLLLKYLTDELTEVSAVPGTPGEAGSGKGSGGQGNAPAHSRSPEAQTTRAVAGENKVVQVAKKYILHIQDDKTLMDKSLMSVLSKIVEELIAQKEQETMKTLIQRLAANLNSPNSEIRISAARGLADIIERLQGDLVVETVNLISIQLVVWVKVETVFSVEYQRICMILKNIVQDYINRKQYDKALTYIEAFDANLTGAVEKTDSVKNVSAEMIQQLTSPENLDILMAEIASPASVSREGAGTVFAAMGDIAVHKMLDRLRETTDSDERVKMMHLIMAAKNRALPLIAGRIKKSEPWYYLRNLAYMLGQIGNEEIARLLAPLLQNENPKLRQEVLKSIHRIGGQQKGPILLAALQQATDEFKAGIVEVLGQSKATDAVHGLLELLKERPLMPSASRLNLEEKICTALGLLGSPEAIPALSEIAETKSFLGLRSYPDRVKAAASRALVILRRKTAESAPDKGVNL